MYLGRSVRSAQVNGRGESKSGRRPKAAGLSDDTTLLLAYRGRKNAVLRRLYKQKIIAVCW